MEKISEIALVAASKRNAFCVLKHKFHNSVYVAKGAKQYFDVYRPLKDPARQDPDYFEKQAEKLPLDEHYLDNLKFLWEEKVGNARELYLKSSDFLVGNTTYALPDIDRHAPRLEYRKVDALKDAPEAVKKIFSVEMGERADLTAAWKHHLIDKVSGHEFDKSSYESKIAWATACIRHYTALSNEMIARHPKNKRPKWLLHRIFLLVGWRRKQLRFLRDQDAESFERVLRELKIAYHVPREPEHVHTRKAWSEHQLRCRCLAEKESKLRDLEAQLAEGREARVASMDAELEALDAEETKNNAKLREFAIVEGRAVDPLAARYEPKLVEEFSEIMLHMDLFYHPPPRHAKVQSVSAL